MAEITLPPLPDADDEIMIKVAGRGAWVDAYRPSTMQAYALECVEADRKAQRAAAEDLLALQMFADSCVGEFPDIGDIDGFALQDIAESCGLLKPQSTQVPCGEECSCAEVVKEGQTTECYRVQPVLRRARVASARAFAARRALIDKEAPGDTKGGA